PPYTFSWDTATVTNGQHTVVAIALSGKSSTASDPALVTVQNTCTIYATASCETTGGTFITFNNVTSTQGNTAFVFACTGSLVKYRNTAATITGSGWPVHLDIDYSPGVFDYAAGTPVSAGTIADVDGVSLGDGCTGDGNPDTIDLIVHIEGDGRTYGLQQDAVKLVGNFGPS